MNLLTEQRDAEDALDSRDRRRSLSTSSFERLRTLLLSDSYLFTKKICRHNDLIPDYHMALSYAVCGLTDRLIECFDLFDNYVIDQFKRGLRTRNIDWRTAAGRADLDIALEFQYHCWTRGAYKSSVTTHGAPLFLATNDPNLTIKITHAVDDKAWQFCDQIGKTVQTGLYRDVFPDRIPENESRDITMKAINLGGRSISHPQKTINASGYGTKDESAHYDTYFTDDLVTEWNTAPSDLKSVDRWLRGMNGFFMPNRRIRRVHVGTKHESGDDHDFLTTKTRALDCLTIKVPIEDHQGKMKGLSDILRRGMPCIPLLFPLSAVTRRQREVLSDETETDGVLKWCWNNLLIDSLTAGARLFPPSLVDEPDHWWIREYQHDKESQRRMGRYLVSRFMRDEEGNPLAAKGATIYDEKEELLPDWRDHAEELILCPWADMDRVALVDPAWASVMDNNRTGMRDPDNWAVSIVGTDYQGVALQLETRSGTTGVEGWIEALCEMDQFWRVRVIGFDGAAMQDAMIRNLMQTDQRLRRLKNRMLAVPHNGKSKRARQRAGLAEPLSMYKFLLRPGEGGNETREELKGIRSIDTDRDGIADSLAMHRAVNKRMRSRDEFEKTAPPRKVAIHPMLGVPFAA